MGYGGKVLPPPNVKVANLTPGQVDTANFVVKPSLAVSAYEAITASLNVADHRLLLVSDFLAFSHMRERVADAPTDPAAVIGFHDGLRWKSFIRHILGIGPMQLGSKAWVRRLTGGRLAVRAAGGLE